VAVVGADDTVDGPVRQRQYRQFAQQVVETWIGELREQALELVHRGLEDEDLVEAVEAVQRATGGIRAQHTDDAAHFWLK
jgi:hypothetical protein